MAKMTISWPLALVTLSLTCMTAPGMAQTGGKPAAPALQEITARTDPEEGWGADIILSIVEERRTDAARVYVVRGMHKGRTVGLQIDVSSGIREVVFRSIGAESDVLLQALAGLYEQPALTHFTKQGVTAAAVSFGQTVDLDRKADYELKLFFAEDNEELYSELYLNISTARREVELKEKDEEYREALIKLFSM